MLVGLDKGEETLLDLTLCQLVRGKDVEGRAGPELKGQQDCKLQEGRLAELGGTA